MFTIGGSIKREYKPILILLGINLIYSLTYIFSKEASLYTPFSWKYINCVIGMFVTMGTYAFIWQQVIKRMAISDAYMFRGTAIIFTMLIAAICFGETIGVKNIIGSVIIICGIALFAKA